MPDKVNISFDNGNEKEADLLCYLKDDNIGKVIMYTFNEKEENDLVTIHVAKVIESDGGIRFNKIEDENEWAQVKNWMRELITGGAN